MYKYIVAVILSIFSLFATAETTLLDFEKFSYRDIKFTDSKDTIAENKNYSCTRFACTGVSIGPNRNQSDIDISFVDNRIKEIEVSIETETLATCSSIINELANTYKTQYSVDTIIDKNVDEHHDIYVVDGDINTTRGKIHINSMCFKFKDTKETKVVTSFEFSDIIVDTIKEEFNYGK